MSSRGKRRRNRRGRRRGRRIWPVTIVLAGILAGGAALGILLFAGKDTRERPKERLVRYMECIPQRRYEDMYEMLDVETSGGISREDFITRNSAIYEGIEVADMEVEILSSDEEQLEVTYRSSFDTAAGEVSFENKAYFVEREEGFYLAWDNALIFPELKETDRVRVSVTQAKRGEIYDRNGRMLAGEGTASSVGIVPGKYESENGEAEEIARLLGIQPETIEKRLSAKWVKEDSFVPIKTIPRVEEVELLKENPDEEVLREKERQDALLEIPGIMISDTKVRSYPLKEAAAHLIGYVQNVTAEDLENHAGEGYTANSVIGRSGIEGLYEKELKGQNGCRIYITDESGEEKKELASRPVRHGENVRLTIDSALQEALYEEFWEDKGCSVAVDPDTGEVLALVSTPSYDSNSFIRGFSEEEWSALNENESKPLYNRFRQVWCPGSTFKPVIAAIGLETGAVDPLEDYGREGLSWQKDASWGGYYVTTLHEYEPVILENALIYSDNIYFAKAALKIGAENLVSSLQNLGFGENLPFEISMSESQFSNTEKIETEIQLADSGYGQGQILINPLHLACIYSAFCNEGNMLKPSLLYQPEREAEQWISGAFSPETAERVKEAARKIVNDPHGTGYAAHREDIVLAGKTGTAEIKASKDDTSGTELGWFAVFTYEEQAEKPILLISMVEDVKGRGGSGYVVEKDRQVLERWFGGAD